MTVVSSEAGVRRTRRSSQELRETILREARAAFAANGYQGTSTRTIAAAAGASESLIFTNWGSKAALFRHAVLEPFETVVAQFQDDWSAEPRTVTLEREARTYIGGLYDAFCRHRELVLALVSAETFESDVLVDELHETFQPVIEPVIVLVRQECDRRGWTGIDPAMVTRTMFGTVVSMAVLDDMMFGRGARPARDEVVEQLTGFWVAAIAMKGRQSLRTGE